MEESVVQEAAFGLESVQKLIKLLAQSQHQQEPKASMDLEMDCRAGARESKQGKGLNPIRGPVLDDNMSPFNEREDCVADYKESFYYPPGYRFAPTDNELVEDYLDIKRRGLWSNVIHEVDLYDHNPQILTS
ncbi:hypothetical protein RJ640_007002 [Escallonia rubra]|uniref:NAC domain-containing protein n=1 Tax=Escallonia rubra TaxID=112253 RepID=A0AA88UGL7_9ASTE|nr:hypothetical protein RJ640_007002 [Escallonia rubra]